MGDLRIGDLAERTGTSVPTIRYYEAIGLLRRAARQASGQRVYRREDVDRLTFIRRCRDFDFSIEQVRTLVSITQDPNRSCMAARDMAAEHLTAVRAKMRELKALERSLISFVDSCDASCAGGPGPDCIILEDLAKARGGNGRAARADRSTQ
ncbi:MAG: helix-turn-helix domain-containing protein [Acidobacteriota bacterium]|nr:helix-turn-helix domain-containing protein [Acidobacteriota bacterium]